MKTILFFSVLFIANLVSASDLSDGEDSFAVNCAVCHSLAVPPKNKVGPSLIGVVGSPSAKAEGFQYSDALKNANIVWTTENLDKYLTNPTAMIPGNKMPFKGLTKEAERKNLINYLTQKGAKK